jgi:hypothetical protein
MQKKLKIAWDTDDTLIIPSVVTGDRDVPNYETIAVYRYFQRLGYDMIIWSGSGVDWATTWKEKLGLEGRVIPKGSEEVDIAFDDCDVTLGTVNIKVKRVANNISREQWNKQKR